MSAPYRDHLAAIRAALNVDARSMYKPASWQHQAMIGYREELPPAPGDLTKWERFQQDCMTFAFLRERMPANQWAAIIVRHGLRITDPRAQAVELERYRWAVVEMVKQDQWGHDFSYAVWSVEKWGNKLTKAEAGWQRWEEGSTPVRTLQYRYNATAKVFDDKLRAAEVTAERLLSDGGLIQRAAA